jgi:hypothetical protein
MYDLWTYFIFAFNKKRDYILKILTLSLAQAKNGDKQFWKEKFHIANGKAQHALMKGPVFSFLRGQGERDIFEIML